MNKGFLPPPLYRAWMVSMVPGHVGAGVSSAIVGIICELTVKCNLSDVMVEGLVHDALLFNSTQIESLSWKEAALRTLSVALAMLVPFLNHVKVGKVPPFTEWARKVANVFWQNTWSPSKKILACCFGESIIMESLVAVLELSQLSEEITSAFITSPFCKVLEAKYSVGFSSNWSFTNQRY